MPLYTRRSNAGFKNRRLLDFIRSPVINKIINKDWLDKMDNKWFIKLGWIEPGWIELCWIKWITSDNKW
jgi:hypothetical protein